MVRVKKTIEEKESVAERAFITQWLRFGTFTLDEEIPMYREYKFDPKRNSRFDFAWPEQKVACEIEGGTWQRGGHTTGTGYQKDCEKYNRAIELGWRVLRYTPQMVEAAPDEVIAQVERVIRGIK